MITLKKSLLIFLISALFLEVSAKDCSIDSLIHRSIKASDTDDKIAWELQNHHIYFNPDCDQNGKLLIHLVGTFDNPANTTYFPILAANNGFRVIVLKYPNGIAAKTACATSVDTLCFRNFRQEITLGTDASSEVEVDSTNCISNRMNKLILYLAQEYPGENWNDFLTRSSEVDWSRIMLSGHSQGGGHAAYLAKIFQIDRVLMFASPNDYSTHFGAPAGWLSLSSQTSEDNYFAFGNIHDEVVDFEQQYQNWQNLSLLTKRDSVWVDNKDCNLGASNVLYTHLKSTRNSGSHSNLIIDSYLPMEQDSPVFTATWKYMLGVCNSTISAPSVSDDPFLTIFPNPSKGAFRIEAQSPIVRINLIDHRGSSIHQISLHDYSYSLQLKSYQGLCFVYISLANGSEIIKKIAITE